MRGWFKIKDSYKKLKKGKNFEGIAKEKHNQLMNGEIVFLESNPRLLNNDLTDDLEACDDPSIKKKKSKGDK